MLKESHLYLLYGLSPNVLGATATAYTQMMAGRVIFSVLVVLTAILTTAGCTGPAGKNTSLTSEDLRTMTDRMAQSLMADPDVARHLAEGKAMIITLYRVSNQTNDIIPEREKWLFMARLRAQLSQSGPVRQQKVRFILPAKWAQRLRQDHPEAGGGRQSPTHALTATFYALTSVTHRRRSDHYLCAFQLIEMSTGSTGLILWEDKYEIRRRTVRNKLD